MIIDNLPVLPKPIQDTDEVPVERGTKTYKDTLGNIIGEYTAGAVSDWLDENIPTGQTVVVDKSLTVDGAAADAKKTGDEITALKGETSANKANFAGAFVQATAYPAGTYVTYTDGFMYVLPNGHEADVTWANTAKTQVSVGGELSELTSAVQLDEKYALLLHDEIPGTMQTIEFDSSGNVSTITHTNGSNVAVRTDAFTFAANSITEVRTLNTGETLTVVTNTTTLVTTVTYAAAA